MLIAVIILSISIIILLVILFAIVKRALAMQRITDTIDLAFDFISKRIEYADNRIHEIDSRGHFESDDEVGFFFTEIKNIQKILNEFNTIYNNLDVKKEKK